MATVKGVWTFKDIVDPFTAPAENIVQSVNFTTADGVARTEIEIKDGIDTAPVLLNLGGWTVAIYDVGRFRWVGPYLEDEVGNQNFKTIDFGTTEQEVSDEFYTLFTQITMTLADKLVQVAENQQRVYDVGYTAGQEAGGTDERFKSLAEATIEEINDDTITKARDYAFAYCKSLKTATLNKLESGGSSFFRDCTVLETISMPALTRTPYTGFMGCTSLKNVYLPNATDNFGAFYNCKALEFIDLPNFGYISDAVFQGCTALKVIVLRRNVVATLYTVNAFSSTPFRNGVGGTIYVPQAYLEQYKTATNWNALESTTFLPIEGSEYE